MFQLYGSNISSHREVGKLTVGAVQVGNAEDVDVAALGQAVERTGADTGAGVEGGGDGSNHAGKENNNGSEGLHLGGNGGFGVRRSW